MEDRKTAEEESRPFHKSIRKMITEKRKRRME